MEPTKPADHQHERYMRRCIELAEIAKQRGDAPVGSVVVLDDEIIGEGIDGLPTSLDITAHAEVIACQAAVDRIGSRQLTGASLYTTAEPCFMCSYVIRQSRIALVVYGIETPKVGGVTSSMPILSSEQLTHWFAPPEIAGGVFWESCEALRLRSK